MSAILVFLAAIAGIIGWWMMHQRLASRPWLEVGRAGEAQSPQGSPLPAAKIGLGIFLAVVGALFTLFISAYLIRMGGADWWGMPIPQLVWVNTVVLCGCSAALQWAKYEAWRERTEALNTALAVAFVAISLFLAGQILAWRQLVAAGYLLADNPSNSFFYMITAMHGLHVLGGLLALGRTAIRVWHGLTPEKARLSVDLCAIYQHFMLAVWLVLLALFTGWANDFADLCRQLVS